MQGMQPAGPELAAPRELTRQRRQLLAEAHRAQHADGARALAGLPLHLQQHLARGALPPLALQRQLQLQATHRRWCSRCGSSCCLLLQALYRVRQQRLHRLLRVCRRLLLRWLLCRRR